MKVKFNSITRVMVISVLSLLSACAVTDMDESTDFSRYKTFAWSEADIAVDPIYDRDVIHKNIRSTVEQEFTERGIVLVDKKPDFLVGYRTHTDKKAVSGKLSPLQSDSKDYIASRFAISSENTSRNIAGTLIIEISDRKTGDLVWRGAVSGSLSRTGLEKQLEKAVRSIMKKYPVERSNSKNNHAIS